ncbi:MAG: hypothetical protein DRP01_08825 [Archaeoglobales archaeon]|nr:MAG: hypothetical protein DRP01_08825 [Archaeoglobales archaeon]
MIGTSFTVGVLSINYTCTARILKRIVVVLFPNPVFIFFHKPTIGVLYFKRKLVCSTDLFSELELF